MEKRKGKFKVKNNTGGYDQIMMETEMNRIIDSPIKGLDRNTSYELDDIVAESTCKGAFLVCTFAGTTGESVASGFATAEEGQEITDGSAKFTVHYFKDVVSKINIMSGATSSKGGTAGLVPVPAAGAQNKALFGDGTYKQVDTVLKNALARQKAYQVGDIAYSPNLPSWAYLSCVVAGTTAAAEPSFTDVTVMGKYITDGSAKWIVEDIRFNTPVGVVFYDSYLHAGCVKFNGATVNRADYVRLEKLANDNNLWTDNPSSEPYKYGRGNGSTTMVLPDFRNRVIQGGDITGIKKAGLPNITGDANLTDDDVFYYVMCSSNPTGCFKNKVVNAPAISSANSPTKDRNVATFDASCSNSIYGNSDTVQPPALVLIPQIKF